MQNSSRRCGALLGTKWVLHIGMAYGSLLRNWGSNSASLLGTPTAGRPAILNSSLSLSLMESSSSRRHSRSHPYASSNSHEKFSYKQVEQAAIIGKSCAICLSSIENCKAAVLAVCKHVYCVDCIRKWSNFKRNCPLCNAQFTSWFFDINLSSRTFRTEQLAGLSEVRKVATGDSSGRRRRDLVRDQRVIRRSREEFNVSNSGTRRLPTQRSFGHSRLVPPDVITERVQRWRASIYEQHLQAVPCSTRNYLQQYAPGKFGVKERLMQRIQPWMRRELQAILGDPDPSIVVHVATSLFMSSFEEQHKAGSGQSMVGENNLKPLRSFLFEKTNIFWHELRCFAESSLNMETYDTVVEYIKQF